MIKNNKSDKLMITSKKFLFSGEDKEKLEAELILANKALAYKDAEKLKREVDLVIANKELVFKNEENENRAAELIIANKELAFQNEEKEYWVAELMIANKELLAFTNMSSHYLPEPLRKIQTFITIILKNENKNLSEKGKYIFQRMQMAAQRIQQFIDDLLAFCLINTADHTFEKNDFNHIIGEVKNKLRDRVEEKHTTIEVAEICKVNIIVFQVRQLIYNLGSNALKFSNPNKLAHIIIKRVHNKDNVLNGAISHKKIIGKAVSQVDQKKFSPKENYCHINVFDNSIGFKPHFKEHIFSVFQKLQSKEIDAGTKMGLANVKK